MKEEIKQLIRTEAIKIEEIFSKHDRGFNYNQETFKLDRIIPLSENTAALVYNKNTGKKVLFYIQYIKTGNGGFLNYFVIKYQHFDDFEKMKIIMHDVECHNFKIKGDMI